MPLAATHQTPIISNEGSVEGLRKGPSRVTLPSDTLLDSDQAAAIMQIHPKTLQKLARKGVVRGMQIGKLWRFRASDIHEWIDQQIAS